MYIHEVLMNEEKTNLAFPLELLLASVFNEKVFDISKNDEQNEMFSFAVQIWQVIFLA